MKNRMYYFAYGQNMNPNSMRECCPHAKAICAARLKNYRLAERRYADIDPDPASEVYGVLYSITPGDKKSLDLYAGYLKVFTEVEVEVVFGDDTFKARTYMMTPEGKKQCDGIPYEHDYIRQCRRGALHYLVPNSFRFANVFAYGTNMSGEKDDTFYKYAVSIRPCTLTGTLYDSGCGFPVFSSDGHTVVEAEHLRIPRNLWETVLNDIASSPFKPEFLVGRAPDGSTFGGWAICMKDMPPRARVIESGSWRGERKLKYDSLVFSFKGEGCDTHIMIDFSENEIYGQLFGLDSGEPEETEIELSCHLSRYWRKEIRAMIRDCHLERWQEAGFSNGENKTRWLLVLKNGEKRVRFMCGHDIFPLNWDMFLNVVKLCFRLCRKGADPSVHVQGPAADKTDILPAPETAPMTEPELPLFSEEDADGAAPETDPMTEPELPLFSEEDADGAAPAEASAVENSTEEQGSDDGDVSSPDRPPAPDDVDAWFSYVLENPGAMDERNCPADRFSLEQWKELILTWPMLLQYDPPSELRKILTKDDFSSWSGYQVCEALFMDGQWLADLFPMDHITQEDFDNCFGADAFEGPEDYWDVIPEYFPYGIPPQIRLPFPHPDRNDLG